MRLLPLAAVAALSLVPAAQAAAQSPSIVIQTWSYGFAPQPIHLSAGRKVILTFLNQSGSSHDFKAVSFFGRSTILAGTAPEGEIDLPPHSSRTISLIPRAGTYSAHCSHFFHAQMGMHDTIVVD